MTSFASLSLTLSLKAMALIPLKTKEWIAPIFAQARLAIGIYKII
jgi:hypothetical protein